MAVASDAFRVAGELVEMGLKATVGMAAVTTHYGQLLKTQVQANASGRPGPNVITGDYWRSISLEVQKSLFDSIAIVGTGHPAGRRLEYGFVGVDSLGRQYNQPPYPHFGPAFDKIAPQFLNACQRMVRVL